MTRGAREGARVLIPTGLGLNCEEETRLAFRLLGVEPDLVPWTDLFAGTAPRPLTAYRVLVLVGGFSYGDHVAGGLVLATRIRARLLEPLRAFLSEGGLVLGICNGFQVLVRLGLLPGPEGGDADFVPRAALSTNDRLGYRDAWVRLGAEECSPCVWTRGLGRFELPSRHGEGKFLLPDRASLAALEERGGVALRYLDAQGAPAESWPDNPNGSPGGVAGVTDASGRILGVMPHPDAYLRSWQHPGALERAGGEAEGEEPAGLRLFRAGLEAALAT
jgi:phosphoribosylformylglycinamidine synthase